ncbi:MAG: MFS transporter [Desulfobacterales bacterium]|nr:MFS transporter [Desulfobacterales bacterium]
MQALQAAKDQYFKQNAAGISVVEFFWGLGFPVLMESTFLQIFLKNLGASDFLIGLVPGILMAGISACPLISSYLTRKAIRTRPLVLGFHLLSSVVVLGFGTGLLFLRNPDWILPLFFVAYVIFSVSIGLTFPIWLNFLVKIFSPGKNVKGLSFMYLAQNLAKIMASVFILKVVEVYQLSLASSAWIFIGAGILFLVGSFGFLITREITDPPESKALPGEKENPKGFVSHLRETARSILGNRNMVFYLAGDLDNYIVITVIGFYANYATGFFAVSQAIAAGFYITLIYSGSITANFTMGYLGLGSLRQKYLATKVICALALVLLIALPGPASFFMVSFMLGFCRGTRNLIYSPLIKQLSGREDATAFFAVAPLLTIWFTSGFPLFFGGMLDQMTTLGADAYRIMFGLALALVFITFALGWQARFNFTSPLDTMGNSS